MKCANSADIEYLITGFSDLKNINYERFGSTVWFLGVCNATHVPVDVDFEEIKVGWLHVLAHYVPEHLLFAVHVGASVCPYFFGWRLGDALVVVAGSLDDGFYHGDFSCSGLAIAILRSKCLAQDLEFKLTLRFGASPYDVDGFRLTRSRPRDSHGRVACQDMVERVAIGPRGRSGSIAISHLCDRQATIPPSKSP